MKFNELYSGLAFIPFTIPLVLANIISGKLGNKYNPLKPIHIGIILIILGLIFLAIPTIEPGYLYILPCLLLISFGVGLITPMITSIAMLTIQQEKSGMVSGVVNYARQIAGAFGVAIYGLYAELSISAHSYLYFQYILIISIVLLLISIIYFWITLDMFTKKSLINFLVSYHSMYKLEKRLKP